MLRIKERNRERNGRRFGLALPPLRAADEQALGRWRQLHGAGRFGLGGAEFVELLPQGGVAAGQHAVQIL